MTTRQYVFLVVLFFLSIFVAYQVAAWQMTPKHRVGGAAGMLWEDPQAVGTGNVGRREYPPHSARSVPQRFKPDPAHYFLAIQRGPDVGPPTDKPGPQHPVDPPGNHEIPCDPSRGKCST